MDDSGRHASSRVSLSNGSALIAKSSPTKSERGGEDDSELCNGQNIEECLVYLNEEITSFGMPPLLATRWQHGDLCCLINTMHMLLRKLQRTGHTREDLENRLHSAEAELILRRAQASRLKDEAKDLLFEVARLREAERQQAVRLTSLQGKLKIESDETKRVKSVMQSRDAQYLHELKKHEKEAALMKERAARSLLYVTSAAGCGRSSDKDRPPGMNILNVLPSSAGQKGKKKSDGSCTRSDEDMYKTAISNYERQRRLLVAENSEIRRCLADVHHEVVMLLVACTTLEGRGLDDGIGALSKKAGDQPDIHNGLFQLPYNLASRKIQESFRKHCSMLRKKYNQTGLREGHTEERPHSVDALFTSTIPAGIGHCAGAKEDLPHCARGDESPSGALFKVCAPKSCSLFENETSVLVEGRALLEKERQRLKELMIGFNAERSSFEDEKMAWLKKQFFSSGVSPVTSAPSSHTVADTNTKRALPMVSSLPQTSVGAKREQRSKTA